MGQLPFLTQYKKNYSEPMSSVAFETPTAVPKSKTVAGATHTYLPGDEQTDQQGWTKEGGLS